jgi:putative hemolysin
MTKRQITFLVVLACAVLCVLGSGGYVVISTERAYQQAIALPIDTPAPMDTPVSPATATSPPTLTSPPAPAPEACSESQPAHAYCMELGYKCEVRTGENGGVCIFPDGTECEAWSFFRGNCGQEKTYCEQQGFTIENRIDDMGTWTAEYAVCVFSDGSECLEQDYLAGECSPSDCAKWWMSEGGCIRCDALDQVTNGDWSCIN